MSRRKTLFSITLLVSVLLLPGLIRAFDIGDVHFYITNETLFNYNQLAETESQYYESLSIFSNYKKWSVGFTLRGKNFFKQDPNVTLDDPEFDVYRKYIEYNSKHLKFSAGDFYSLLGRGMVLAVLKNDDVLRERTILGGNVEYNKGRMHLKALGGVIKDETGDQEWSVAGGEIGYEYVKNHKVGVHFSYIDDVDTVRSLGRRLTYSFSLRGNRLFKNVGYYSEFAILDFQDIVRDNGYGFFSGITFSKSRFSGFFEVKSYKDFDNEMNNPPVADRIDEIATLNDTAGARLYLQYTFAEPDITLFVNFGRYREYEDTGNHYYGGFSIEDLWDKFNFSASYGVRDIFYPVKKFDTYIIYQFSDTWSVEMSMKTKRYSDNAYEFQEDDYGFQVNYSPYVSLFVLHQYSHNQVMDLNNFYSGGVKVYLKCGTAIEVSGGTVRGGQICSGGQCFVAPPFKGVKFSLLHTFK